MVKAIIFDLDGVLVDSTPLQREANYEFIESFGKVFLPSPGREGMRIVDIVREYKDIYDLPGSVDDLTQKRQQIFYVKVQKKLTLVSGVERLFEKLKQLGLTCALATSGDRRYVDIILQKFAWLNKYFKVIMTGDDVIRGKPYPDIYKKTLAAVKLSAHECVVIEDSINGILASKAAGIPVIAVPNKHYPEQDYSIADRVFTTLSQVTRALK